MNEIWKNVKDYEGLYEVSNLGRVRNFKNKKIKTSHLNNKGYVRVNLSKKNKSHSGRVHRLVAMAFLTTSDITKEVNHKDFNKLNNTPENLEWVTGEENINHYLNSDKYKNSIK